MRKKRVLFCSLSFEQCHAVASLLKRTTLGDYQAACRSDLANTDDCLATDMRKASDAFAELLARHKPLKIGGIAEISLTALTVELTNNEARAFRRFVERLTLNDCQTKCRQRDRKTMASQMLSGSQAIAAALQ